MANAQRQISFGDFLVREGLISQAQFNQALALQGESVRSIGRILVEMGLISENMRMGLLRKEFGFSLIGLKELVVPPEILVLIPYSFAEKHRVVPVRVEKKSLLIVAMEDPSDLLVVDAIKNQVGVGVRACVASQEDVQHVLDQYQTGNDEQPILTTEHPRAVRTRAQQFVIFISFVMVAALPLALFFLAIWFNVGGFQSWLNNMRSIGNLHTWDLLLYLILTWGLWTVILYEIYGLVCGNDEEEG